MDEKRAFKVWCGHCKEYQWSKEIEGTKDYWVKFHLRCGHSQAWKFYNEKEAANK